MIARMRRHLMRRPMTAHVAALVIVLLGVIAAVRLPRLDRVDFDGPRVFITAKLPGARPNGVAEAVAAPLERAVAGSQGLVGIASRSSEGGQCDVTLTFSVGTLAEEARDEIERRIDRAAATLPAAVRKAAVRVDLRSLNPLVIVSVVSPKGGRDAAYLQAYAASDLASALRGIPGVAIVESLGAEPGDVKVNLSTAAALGVFDDGLVNRRDVAAAVRAAVDRLDVTRPSDVAIDIAFDGAALAAYRLEVALAALALVVAITSLMAALLLLNLRMALLLAVAEALTLSAVVAGMLGLGFSLNPTTLLGVIIGLALVVDDTMVMLVRACEVLRPTRLTPASAVDPQADDELKRVTTTLERAIGIMDVKGHGGKSALSTAANEIEAEEARWQGLRGGLERVARDSAGAMGVGAALLLTLAVGLASADGASGQLARQILGPAAMAAVASALLALTVLPSLVVAWLRPINAGWFVAGLDRRWQRAAQRAGRITMRATHWSAPLLAGLVGIIAAAAVVGHFAPKGFFTRGDANYVIVHARLPVGADRAQSRAVAAKIEAVLEQTPAITDVVSIAGYSALDGRKADNAATCIVVLMPPVRRCDSEFAATRIAERLQRRLDAVPDAVCAVLVPSIHGRLGETGQLQLNLRDVGGERPLSPSANTEIGALPRGVALEKAACELQHRAETAGVLAWSDVRLAGASSVDRANMAPAVTLRGDINASYRLDAAITACDVLGDDVLPLDVEAQWAGPARDYLRSRGQWFAAVAFAIALAWLLLAAAWQRVSPPLVVLLAAPLTVVGAIAAAAASGFELDIYWQLGIMAAIVIAGKHNMRFVAQARSERPRHDTISQTAESACSKGFRTATVATSLLLAGLSPLMLVGTAGESDLHCLGAALLGGLVSAAALGFVFVPVLWAIMQWITERLQASEGAAIESIWLPRIERREPRHARRSHRAAKAPPIQVDERLIAGRIYTVLGWIAPENLGTTLPHEHIILDATDASVNARTHCDIDYVVRRLQEPLAILRKKGCRTIVDATTAGRGRNAALLKKVSQHTGLQILTNTGYWGADEGKYLPSCVFRESADQLSERWVAECRRGIDSTGVRPGYIMIGVNPGPLSDIDEKLVRAAIRTHRETGLTIASHTAGAEAAIEQLAILEKEGIDPSAWIWVHAQAEPDRQRIVEVAQRGAWIMFDDVDAATVPMNVKRIMHLVEHGLLGQVLLSQSHEGYQLGQPHGGKIAPFHTLFKALIPELFRAGLLLENVEQMTAVNPMNAFIVRIRSKATAADGAST